MSGKNTPDAHSIRSISYESTRPGRAPIPITVAPKPSAAQLGIHPSLRPRTSPAPSVADRGSRGPPPSDATPRDSCFTATTDSAQRDSRTTIGTEDSAALAPGAAAAPGGGGAAVRRAPSVRKSQSLPRIRTPKSGSPPAKGKRIWSAAAPGQGAKAAAAAAVKEGAPALPSSPSQDTPTLPAVSLLSPPAPQLSISFDDLTTPDKIEFSKRGSMLIKGRKANDRPTKAGGSQPPSQPPSQNPSRPASIKRPAKVPQETLSVMPDAPRRAVSSEEEATSQRVRSMYDSGADPSAAPTPEPRSPAVVVVSLSGAPSEAPTPITSPTSSTRDWATATPPPPPPPPATVRPATILEDYQDVDSGDVDRYGFIVPRPAAGAAAGALAVPEMHRAATSLQLASETPRRRASRLSRAPSAAGSARSAGPPAASASATNLSPRAPSAASQRRPLSSQSSARRSAGSGGDESAGRRRSVSRMRSVTNRLPHNRARRAVDEAGDMLTLPPGLADIAESEEGGRAADALKRREWAREEKWRRMATVSRPASSSGGPGGGAATAPPVVGTTTFTFDPRHPKMASRTWKGIPDRWRATAWHSFLAASAAARPEAATDAQLGAAFDALAARPSPDDGQIDLDVPRTVGGHVLFRRRFGHGQRALFRVLHAVSLHLPRLGYVQGMAGLAATLLCYFEERAAFVNLVRMFEYRGLARLYAAGFQGLMQALDELERDWLRGTVVESKLTELGIAPTAYGTRWYLTLFNYSMPFASQLRVWDVFLLLGDPEILKPSRLAPPLPAPSAPKETTLSNGAAAAAAPHDRSSSAGSAYEGCGGNFDLLHAVSAALIDAMREILLDADFENAMKCLTSWVPVRDEELLMRVAKAEWKGHRRKK